MPLNSLDLGISVSADAKTILHLAKASFATMLLATPDSLPVSVLTPSLALVSHGRSGDLSKQGLPRRGFSSLPQSSPYS